MTSSSHEHDPQERADEAKDHVVPGATDSPGSADYVDGVPTFDFVRDRIEGRYATAVGTTELSEESSAGRSLTQQQEDRDAAARARLDEIRRSLRGD